MGFIERFNSPSLKTGRLLLPNNIGKLNLSTTRSFESIISVLQKIHNEFSPFLWLHSDPLDQNVYTVTCVFMSYKIYIYTDIESNMYIIELINVNMAADIIENIFKQLQNKMF